MTKITLRDYSGKAHEIEIDDNVEFICGVVITGAIWLWFIQAITIQEIAA